MYTYIEGHCAKIMGCCTSNVPTVKVAAAENGQKFRFKMELPRKKYNLKIRQFTTQYAGLLGQWDKQLVDQASDVPSIFFHNFL